MPDDYKKTFNVYVNLKFPSERSDKLIMQDLQGLRPDMCLESDSIYAVEKEVLKFIKSRFIGDLSDYLDTQDYTKFPFLLAYVCQTDGYPEYIPVSLCRVFYTSLHKIKFEWN